MKRTGNLYEAICDPENLRLAFWKARKGKAFRPDVRRFAADLSANLERLRRGLTDQSVAVGNYRYFTIRDPKTRTICAAPFPERVLHHAIMNVCDPVFERYQIFDSYATRRDKGTFAALERAERFTRPGLWFLKLDVKKYFDTIDHALLKAGLGRLFREKRLIALLNKIVDSYEKSPGKGLPIGNLTSQYFANHYLAVADHFIKERLGVKQYVRYMDDMVLWEADKKVLREKGRELERFLCDRLLLGLKPVCLNRSEQGLPFLGFRVFPGKTLLRPGSRRRFLTKMKIVHEAHAKGLIGQEEFGGRSLALTAHVAHADSRGFRKAVLRDMGRCLGARTA